jgi:hypothetical protein
MSTSDETRPMAPLSTSDALEASARRRRLLIVGGTAAVGVVLLVGVFLLGRSSGSSTQSGPTSLGAALTAARTGSLPCGTSNEVTRRVLDRLCNGNLAAGSGGAGLGGATGQGTGRALMAGTVTSVSGNQVTVQTGQGPVTLTVGSDAAVRTIANASTTDLTNGARVLLTGGAANGAGNGIRQIIVLGTSAPGGVNGGAGTTTPPSS